MTLIHPIKNKQGFPTIKVFGADKKKPVDYKGGRTAKDIVDEGLSSARKLVKDRMGGKPSSSSSSSSSTSSGGKKSGGGKEGGVITLSESDFKEKVIESNDMWLVAFIAPWCGYCKKIEPEWKEAASRLKGKSKPTHPPTHPPISNNSFQTLHSPTYLPIQITQAKSSWGGWTRPCTPLLPLNSTSR